MKARQSAVTSGLEQRLVLQLMATQRTLRLSTMPAKWLLLQT
jgi:hypothetical protein